MKIRDIVVENKLSHEMSEPMPGAAIYPAIRGHYYDMYRLGVAAAGSPEYEQDMAKSGVIGNNMMTMQYTDTDAEIMDVAQKKMGLKAQKVTATGSREPKFVNNKSAVASIKKNRYGV